ncbi:UNVERIFIED_CONTAM: hypothetical protein FKN15_075893 [Acipenser sinensis]
MKKRKDQHLLSPVNCWYLVLNQTRRESRDHATLNDIYMNNVIVRLSQINEDVIRLFKKQIAELQQEESKRNELLAGFKVKIHNLQQELAAERASLAQLQKDRTEIQNKAAALQQSEHQTKVALEQLQSRFERFRGKIIQAAYIAPGAKLLVTEVSDNEILSTMQKIVNDRSEFHQMLIQKGEKVPNLYITETSEKQAKPKSPSKKSRSQSGYSLKKNTMITKQQLHSPNGTQNNKPAMLLHAAAVTPLQRQAKYSENKLKCTKARNDYLLNLAATNSVVAKYYIHDVSDMIDVSIILIVEHDDP